MSLPVIEMTEEDERARKPKVTKVRDGGYCEEREWEIVADSLEWCRWEDVCRHATALVRVRHSRFDGSEFFSLGAIVPRVVKATNEGGCNCTTVCMDCILDAAR